MLFINKYNVIHIPHRNLLLILLNLRTFYCPPRTIISKEIIEQLATANKDRKKSTQQQYCSRVSSIFSLDETHKSLPLSWEYKYFLGGLFAGEGSVNVSAKRNNSTKFGCTLDPELSLAQHVNAIEHLYTLLRVFRTGRIYYKSQSYATFVFVIDARDSLAKVCLPFLEQYCAPFLSPQQRKRLCDFKELLDLFTRGAHRDRELFLSSLLPLWAQMRKQQGQKNESFANLQAAKDWVCCYEKKRILRD